MPNKWLEDYNEWLTTSDIENVLNQYMVEHPSFYFYGGCSNRFCELFG